MTEVVRMPQLELYEKVQVLLSESKKSSEGVLSLLKQRALLEDSHGQGLEAMKALSLSDRGSLGHAVSELMSDCGNKAEQACVFGESIQADLVESVKSFLVSSFSPLYGHLPDISPLLCDSKRAKVQHDSAHIRYRRICSQLDQLLSRLDLRSSDPDQRYSDLSRLVTLKKECWEAAKTYKAAVEQYSEVKGKCEGEMVLLVQGVLGVERCRRELMKDALRKLVVYETAWLRNFQYETEKMAQVGSTQIMESIDVEKDMRQLAQELTLKPLPAVQYKGWIGDAGKPDSTIEETVGLMGKIKRATGRLFQLGGEDKAGLFIAGQFDRAAEGVKMRLEEEFILHSLLKEEAGRKQWLKCLSKRVHKEACQVSRNGLGKLAEQLRLVLHEAGQSREAETVLGAMLQAQRVVARTSEKESLLMHVAGLDVWKNGWVWEKAGKGNVGSTQAIQDYMELLSLNSAFIQKVLGAYVRRPSLSVTSKRSIAPKRTGAKEEGPRPRSSASVTKPPALHTEAMDTDPTEDDIDLNSPEATCIPSFTPFPDSTFQAARRQVLSRFIEVLNLPSDADPALLKSFFSPCGPVQSVQLQGRSAVLEFETAREAEKAVNLTGFDLHDCVLTVVYHTEAPAAA